MRVKVYRNLDHSDGSTLSIVATRGKNTGRVIGLASAVMLWGVKFSVLQHGRNRVNREKKKNIHAYAIGHIKNVRDYVKILEDVKIDESFDFDTVYRERIRYNPYLFNSFVRVDTTPTLELFKKVDTAAEIRIDSSGIYGTGTR